MSTYTIAELAKEITDLFKKRNDFAPNISYDTGFTNSLEGNADELSLVIVSLLEDVTYRCPKKNPELLINVSENSNDEALLDIIIMIKDAPETNENANCNYESARLESIKIQTGILGGEFITGSKEDTAIIYTISVPQKITIDIDIKGIEVKKGLVFVQGKIDRYLRILKEYVKSSVEFKDTLEESFSNDKWDAYGIAAHSIKSNSYSVGADSMGDYAREMEFAAKEENKEFINNNHADFIARYDEMVLNIRTELNEHGLLSSTDDKSPILMLKEAIEDFDSDKSLEILDELSQRGESDELSMIRKYIRELDFISAAEIVNNIQMFV